MSPAQPGPAAVRQAVPASRLFPTVTLVILKAADS